jgi:hypothetical protein
MLLQGHHLVDVTLEQGNLLVPLRDRVVLAIPDVLDAGGRGRAGELDLLLDDVGIALAACVSSAWSPALASAGMAWLSGMNSELRTRSCFSSSISTREPGTRGRSTRTAMLLEVDVEPRHLEVVGIQP